MNFFRAKDYIGKSITAILLAAAIIVGISGPVAAIDPTMVLMFWGGSSAPAGTGFPYTFPFTLE